MARPVFSVKLNSRSSSVSLSIAWSPAFKESETFLHALLHSLFIEVLKVFRPINTGGWGGSNPRNLERLPVSRLVPSTARPPILFVAVKHTTHFTKITPKASVLFIDTIQNGEPWLWLCFWADLPDSCYLTKFCLFCSLVILTQRNLARTDPGLYHGGWAVAHTDNPSKALSWGCISPLPKLSLEKRLSFTGST